MTLNTDKRFYVYILASKKNGTLYTGITSDLVKRVWEHQNHVVKGFSQKYDVTRLVYYEEHSNSLSAIKREKSIKRWRRAWKISLIEKTNPEWNDLYPTL